MSTVDQVELLLEEEYFSAVSKADDEYYVQYFSDELAKIFKDEAVRIWGEDTQISAKLQKDSINKYKIAGLQKNSSVVDIEYKLSFGYDLDFTIQTMYNCEKQREEAEKIFDLIQAVQKSGFTPYTLTFRYLDPNSNAIKRTFFSRYYEHGNWPEIDSVETVLGRIGNSMWDY